MPLYLFGCSECDSEIEEILSFSDIKKYLNTECRDCGAKALYKKVSKTSFTLKGTGWYRDGYRRKT